MGATESCLLAAIVVLVIVIVAVFVYRRYARGESPPRLGRPDLKGDFMPGDPATPALREAVALLSSDLACISQVADSVEGRGRRIEDSYGAVDMGPAFNDAR